MGLFKKKVETESLQEQYDELKQAYKKLEDKYNSAVERNLDDKYDYIQLKKTVEEQREFILQLQNKIYALQEELIAKNKIIQGMDNTDQEGEMNRCPEIVQPDVRTASIKPFASGGS